MYYIPPILQQFEDHSGIPYEAGTVEIYVHGTTSYAVVYADARGESHAQNPVVLDSHGAWKIFVPASVSYDYIVKDSGGNVVFSYYDVAVSSDGSPDVSKQYVDEQGDSLRDQINSVSADLNNKLDKTGNGLNVYVTFDQATALTSLESSDTLAVLFGKIKKWLSSLKALAFKDKASLTQDVSDILRIENGGTGAGTVVGARSNLDVYSKSEVESLLAGRIVFVTVLPATGEAGKIYYLEVDTNVYDTYIWGYAPGATEESWILTGRQELNLDDYKKKQQPYSKTGSKTKTITAISQDANGKIDATFEDIEIPESVPRVNIVSSGGTISVSSSENVQTNTKTFDINVNQKPLSVAWLESSRVEYNGSNHTFTAKRFTLINNGQQNPQGDKITLTDGKLYLKAGTYHVDSRVLINWTGAPQNRVIMIDGIPFDLSYNHSETSCNTSVIAVSSTVLQYFSVTGDESITGLSVSINAIAIYAIEQVMENVVQGLDHVATDDTLTGDGTTGNPLSVAVDNELDADSENPVQNKVLYAVIGNEVTRATNMENELGTAIANEVTRATAAEKAAKTEVKAGDNIEVTKTTGADGHDVYTVNADGKTQVQSDWNQDDSSKVDYIKNKPNLSAVATSGDYNDLNNKPNLALKEDVSNKAQTLNTASTTDYPSSKATADFVNSSIATNTANFLGTYDVVNDLGLSTSATNAQIATALGSYTFATTPTNNDYVFAAIDLYLNTGADEYRRFKFNGTTWAYEYTLNNSSFTAAQWATINSGLSSSDKATYDAAVSMLNAHVADSTIHVTSTDKTTWNGKQNAISTDTDSSTISDSTTIATGYGSNKVHLNTAARLWSYIQDKISSVLGLTSSSYGGNAATADAVAWVNVSGKPTIPDDAGLVHKSGAETITGDKTFKNAWPLHGSETTTVSTYKVPVFLDMGTVYSDWTSAQKDGNHYRHWRIAINPLQASYYAIKVTIIPGYSNQSGVGLLEKVMVTRPRTPTGYVVTYSAYTNAVGDAATEYRINDVHDDSFLGRVVEVVSKYPISNNNAGVIVEVTNYGNSYANQSKATVTATLDIIEGWPSWAGDPNVAPRVQSNGLDVMLKGDNADSATDATYSTKIGSSSSHPAIGSATQPVYVDSNGSVKPCENRIHDLTLQRKVIRIAGKMTGRNLLCDRQNWTGTVDAPVFTPVDPYVLADWINRGDVIQVDFTTYDWWGDKYPGLIVESQCSTLSGESRLVCTNLSVLRKEIVNGQATVNFAWSDIITDEDTNIKYMEFQSI